MEPLGALCGQLAATVGNPGAFRTNQVKHMLIGRASHGLIPAMSSCLLRHYGYHVMSS